MGKTLMGGISQEGSVDLLTPQQQSLLSQILGSAQGANNPQQFNDMFQQSFVDPALQNLNRNVIPQLKESYLGTDEMGSSSLNRALAQSATDVETMLNSQRMGFYDQQMNRGLQGLGVQAFQPIVNQQQGLLSGGLNAFSSGLGGYVGSGGNPIGALMAALGSRQQQPQQQMYKTPKMY